MTTVLLADDEPIALQRLELALACIPGVEVTGTARNGKDAVRLIAELKPDIALLDINMPFLNGLDAATQLRDLKTPPEMIFVTAYSQHAVRAFELNAVDYLLKPVAFDRLQDAIERAQKRIEARGSGQRFRDLLEIISNLKTGKDEQPLYLEDLWVKTRGGLVRVFLADVKVITADGDYAKLDGETFSYLVNETIASLSERLDPNVFIRIHRSTIVKRNSIKRIARRAPRGYCVVTESGATMDIGPSYVNATLELIRAPRWRDS